MLDEPNDLWSTWDANDYDPFEDLTDDEISLYATDPGVGPGDAT